MVYHVQMFKQIENTCQINYEKFDKELKKSQNSLSCFINKTIVNDARELYHQLKNDLSNELHQKTIEMATKLIEQVSHEHARSLSKIRKIKSIFL